MIYVDGLPVISINSFKDTMAGYRPNDEIKLEVRRGDKLQTVEAETGRAEKEADDADYNADEGQVNNIRRAARREPAG